MISLRRGSLILDSIMPYYTFYCNDCQRFFEIVSTIRDYEDHPVCELCKTNQTERQFSIDASTISASVKKSDNELKTIGDLADRNRERMSEDHKHALSHKHNAYKDEESTKRLPQGMSRIKKHKTKNQWRNL